MIVQPLADKHANRIHVDAPDTLGIMEADLTKTRQVLLNVLSNAAKFTRHGDIFVSAARQAGPHGEQVCFQVRDTGIGIESAQLARLFEPFAQADRQLAHPNGGTGLGLALSWRLCRLMGGSLDVASQPNQGSTFTMTLPAVPNDPTPPMASQPVAAVGARGPNAAG
jgi:signal transduction histidine kinase